MPARADRVFISYRRVDAAGYAGRLEEALERRFGGGSVFRDVLDIPPGEDFVKVIRDRLARAHTVLVLIGPRWAGAEANGRRSIDDDGDFVRLEVAIALESGKRVIPVLLPGASMPAESDLPAVLMPLSRRNALTLGDTHWHADVERLAASIGMPPKRSPWRWALGSAVLAAAMALTWLAARPGTTPPPDASARLVGIWQAEVRYAWGDRHRERFEFKRHAGQLAGTADFLGYPRAMENLRFDGTNLHFETRSQETMGSSTREVTRAYAAELRGQAPADVLHFRMESRGNHTSLKPIEFDARRINAGEPGATEHLPARTTP